MSNADKIKSLKKELAELEHAELIFNGLDPEQKLAISLHSTLCRWNHTDGCSWFYEMHPGNIDNWDSYAHNEYLTKARSVSMFCSKNNVSPEAALGLIRLMKD